MRGFKEKANVDQGVIVQCKVCRRERWSKGKQDWQCNAGMRADDKTLAVLRKLATDATGGVRCIVKRRKIDKHFAVAKVGRGGGEYILADGDQARSVLNDAMFIAAASPQVILDLLLRLDLAEAEVREWREREDRRNGSVAP